MENSFFQLFFSVEKCKKIKKKQTKGNEDTAHQRT